MTVSTQTAKSQYTGNGVTTAFTGSFPILDEDHALVILTSTLGVDTTQTIATHYTISGVGGSTFTVTFLTAPASGVKVTIARNVPLTQELDLVENDEMPSAELEKSYDKTAMIDQQINEKTNRALRFPVTDSSSLSAEIPNAATRAGKVLGFDADGEPAVSDAELADLDTLAADVATASAAAATATTQAGIATAAAANLPNATTAGASKYIKSNSGGTGWDYPASIVGTDVDAATASARGTAELATVAEAQAGTDTARVVTPEGLKATVSQIPINSQNGAGYTAVLGDAGKAIMKAAADTSARTYTIPANSSVAYDIGTALTFINEAASGNITISITTDTLVLSPAGTTGSRTLAAYGMATAIKVTATKWMISGTGLT